jgi:TrmH family RNA methyltransferase
LPHSAQFDRLCVVLVRTRNPLNIGAAARAMTNFGARRLRLVTPYEPAFREARSAVGATAVLAGTEEFKSVADAVADCTLVVGTTAIRRRHLKHPLRRLDDGARLIRKRLASTTKRRTNRVALLFGSEKVGLSNEDLSHCHWLLNIPTSEENISMNLGQAVAVCLYELDRNGPAAKNEEKIQTAKAGDVERITAMLLETLRASDYLGRRRVADSEERIRRLIRRMHVQASDVDAWLGMLRQINWKLNSGRDTLQEK